MTCISMQPLRVLNKLRLKNWATTTKVFDKYVDTTKSEVALALPFRDIQYAYEGLDTFLV